jgi:hypothetical protein
VTIPDVGRCQGSSSAPIEGSNEDQDGRATGVCGACSGRFELEDGLLTEHEPAPVDERESHSPDG